MSGASSSLLKRTQLASRGRGLVASQALLAGQVLLHEAPLLTYLDAQTASSNTVCFHCTRPEGNPNPRSNGSWSICPNCKAASFCSPQCAASSSNSTHTPFVCRALSLLVLIRTFDFDSQTQARYLIAAYNLAVVSPHSFQQLLSLEGDGFVDGKIQLLHKFLADAIGSWQLECQSLPMWSVETVASLLAKDQRNGFGLSTYLPATKVRQIRAYAIYGQASFFNHDCLPNACRYDYIDKSGVGNTDIVVRSLHDIPEGIEVCISYFPVNWRFAERQEKLQEEYGFECKCDRCKIEEGWNDDDGIDQGDGISVEEDEEMNSTDEDLMDGEEDNQGSFPHAMFFMKYLCPQESCGGTLAPLPPSEEGAVSPVLECNVCGQLRSEDEFFQEIQEHKLSP